MERRGSNESYPTREHASDISVSDRQAMLAANFCHRIDSYAKGEHQTFTPRPHQPGVLTELADFFHDTAHELGRKIYNAAATQRR